MASRLAQHFSPDEDLTELIRSRVEEGRAVGIVLGVVEADGSTPHRLVRGRLARTHDSR